MVPGTWKSLGRGATAVFLIACALPAAAQFATSVTSYVQGDISAGGFFNPATILGGPQGQGYAAGSPHVLTLGAGGSVTLGFGVTIADGPGIDLVVAENPFFYPLGSASTFAEVAYVEVSTNGADFVRFPSHYAGPMVPLAPFGSAPLGTYRGLAGTTPVFANVVTGIGDPFDPTTGGGDAFDLGELASEAAVQNGLVDLTAIHFVRIVDVRAGIDADSSGQFIFDNGGGGSADIDAVTVVHDSVSANQSGPEVEIDSDPQGFLHVRIGDPDGLQDLDLSSFRCSFDLAPVAGATFLGFFLVQSLTTDCVDLVSVVPVIGQGVFGVLAVSIRDLGLHFSADQYSIQG